MSLGFAEGTEHPDLGPHCWAEKGPCPSLYPCQPRVQLRWVPGIHPKGKWNCEKRMAPPHAQRGCGWGRAVFPPQGLGWKHSQHIPVGTFQSLSPPVPLGLLWGQTLTGPTQPSPVTPQLGLGAARHCPHKEERSQQPGLGPQPWPDTSGHTLGSRRVSQQWK